MAATEVHHLFHHPIADHSFSADHSVLAVARDTSIELYGKVGNAFKLKDELKGHDKTVTSVDIAPNSGRIIVTLWSGSHPQPVISLLWSFFESAGLLPLSDGLPPRTSSPWVPAIASLPSATLKRRTTGGCLST
ncbi:hypothetical protein LB505_005243 [Fusarium chuoi]|nr:hypothetical protein LB505_005243 [Fusarium chuoi]